MNNEFNLSVNKGKLNLKNPVITSSGTFGYGKEFEDFINVNSLGAITIKGTTISPKEGNEPPRLIETPCGLINSIGLANIGIKNVIKEYSQYFKKLRDKGTKIIVNLNANSTDEFQEIVELANKFEHFDYYEINVSCPNVKEGGITFSKDPESVFNLISLVSKITKKPIITKLSPNVQSIKEYIDAAESGGTDIISLVNTFKAAAFDINRRKPVFKNVIAGLSGPAIKPIALYFVYEARKATHLPIIGMGGISSVSDAIEFLIAGADAISIGTYNFIDPSISIKILEGIKKYLKENNLSLSNLKLS